MNPRSCELPEQLWKVAENLLPQPIYKGLGSQGGRPVADFRFILTGIFYVLITGCQWRRVPREFGAPSTIYRYYRAWVKAGIFDKIWSASLKIYDEKVGVRWKWQSIDGSNRKSPFAKDQVGPNPTDRAKQGTKMMVLTDQKGIPLSTIIVPANIHESQLLEATLGELRANKPHPSDGVQNLCGDKAFDSVWCRESAGEFGYCDHFRKRGEEIPKKRRHKPKRWVVERTHSWLNNYRRVATRWDSFAECYQAFVSLACAAIIISKLE